jgi:putative ABC transport system substrate-binding protein
MNRRQFLAVGAAGALLPVKRTFAQQHSRKYRIGYLFPFAPSVNEPYLAALRKGLAVHGFVEGENLEIDARRAYPLHDSEIKKLVADQIFLKADAIFAVFNALVRATLASATSMPVVFAWVGDPVMAGFVKDYAKPGGNATAVSGRFLESAGKRLELVRELLPTAKRVAIAGPMFIPDVKEVATRMRGIASQLGFELMEVDAPPADLVSANHQAISKGAEAVVLLHVYSWLNQQLSGEQLVDLSLKQRVPILFTEAQMAQAGGLVSYGTNLLEDVRRGAALLAKMLRGARPAELAVDVSSPLELAVNMKTAEAMGIRVPSSILARADIVIK